MSQVESMSGIYTNLTSVPLSAGTSERLEKPIKIYQHDNRMVTSTELIVSASELLSSPELSKV